MLSIERKKYLLKVKDVYFAQAPAVENNDADIIIYTQCQSHAPGFKNFSTLHIDLSMDEDAILSGMTKRTRYDIRRADQRDNLTFDIHLSTEEKQMNEFCAFYNAFAKSKGLAPCSRKKLSALRMKNALGYSISRDAKGHPLCYHVNIMDRENRRVRLLHSASLYREVADNQRRRVIGRANRCLHWMEMKEFKKNDFHIYDMGGISPPDADESMKRIDAFKKEFGGVEVFEFHGYIPGTILGRIAIKAMKVSGI